MNGGSPHPDAAMALLTAFSRDRIRLNAVLIVLSFLGVLTLQSQSAASYPTYVLGLVMLFSFQRWNDVFNTRLLWLILALLVYLCLSSFWSDPFDWRSTTSTWIRGLLVLCFVVALAECQLRGQVQKWLGRMLSVAGSLAALTAIANYVTEEPELGRLMGFGQLDNPVVAGLIFAVVLIFLLQIVLVERSHIWKLMAGVCAAIVILAIGLTGSRNAWMSAFIGVFVFLFGYFVRDRLKFVAGIFGIALLTGVVMATLAINPETRELLLPRGDSFRLEIWPAIFDSVISQGAVFGLGITTPDGVAISGEFFEHPHSMYLAVFYQGGIVGVALFLLLIWASMRRLYLHYEHPDTCLSLGLLAMALSSYLLDGHELVDKVGETWFLFWLPIGLSLGVSWSHSLSNREKALH